MKKNIGILSAVLLCIVVISTTSCTEYIINLVHQFSSMGTPDQTSMNYESELLYKKTEGWRQIVTESDFQLDIKENDGKIISVGYGSYPNMVSLIDIRPLTAEFERQHLGLNTSLQFDQFAYYNKTRSNSAQFYVDALKNNNENASGRYNGIDIEKQLIDMVVYPEISSIPIEISGELRREIIAYIPLVFIVDKNNEIDSLTEKQIVDIYSGVADNFKDVGGSDKEIEPYQRSRLTYAHCIVKDIMGDTPMIAPKEVRLKGISGGPTSEPEEYNNSEKSIGYALRNAADQLYGNNVKYLKINGVEPSDENVRNGTYPYYAVIYAVVRREDSNSVGNSYLDWILSDEGQKCVEIAGYVSINAHNTIN